MVWPPQRPDLDIIKSVWDYTKREKQARQPESTGELRQVLGTTYLPSNFKAKCIMENRWCIKGKGRTDKIFISLFAFAVLCLKLTDRSDLQLYFTWCYSQSICYIFVYCSTEFVEWLLRTMLLYVRTSLEGLWYCSKQQGMKWKLKQY